MDKKRINYLNNPNELNNFKREFSLNEFINANYSNFIDNSIFNNKEKLDNEEITNEESNLNVSPLRKNFSESEMKGLGSIEYIGIPKEKDNENSFAGRNCEHRFTSIQILFGFFY